MTCDAALFSGIYAPISVLDTSQIPSRVVIVPVHKLAYSRGAEPATPDSYCLTIMINHGYLVLVDAGGPCECAE